MKLTIVVPDNLVIVDGATLTVDLLQFDVAHIHAVQWRGAAGEIEFADGRPNEQIASLLQFQPIIDAHAAILHAMQNPAPPTPSEAREKLLADIAAHRWEIETGGIVVGGVEIKTDRESQAMITGAHQALTSEFVHSIDWKGANGWATLTLAELEPIAQAVTLHVQGCFRRERVLVDQVAALPDDLAALQGFDIAAAWAAA